MPLKLICKVYDKNGKLERSFKCHSFTRQMLDILSYVFSNNLLSPTVTDATNTPYVFANAAAGLDVALQIGSGATHDDHGILLGTDDTAISPTDYALGAVCAQGTGTGQLQYGTCDVTLASVSGSNISFDILRTVTNNSGSAIDLKEIGFYANVCTNYSSYHEYCLCRDLIAGGITIADADSKTFKYTWIESN